MKADKKVTETEDQVAVFDKQTLIGAADTLGVSREVVVGALYDMTDPITMDEAKERVKSFLGRPIAKEFEGGK